MKPDLTELSIYGDTLKSCHVSGFRLAETKYAPGTKIPKHSHEFAYFSLVLEGTFTGHFGGRVQNGKPFEAVFRRAGEPHSVDFHRAGARLFSIEVGPDCLQNVSAHSLRLEESTEVAGGQLAWLAFRTYREARAMDEFSPLAIEGLVLEMLAAASRRSVKITERPIPHWLKQVEEIINESFAENLSIGGLARSVGIHPVHLATVFRKQYRCTIGECIRQRRIEYASRMLSHSDATLVQIALASGFSDQSHFSKTFKQFTGMSPARFRALLSP